MTKRKVTVKPKPSRRAIGKLVWFERCHTEFAFRGSRMPEEWEEILIDYEDARDNLLNYIASLEQKVKELSND